MWVSQIVVVYGVCACVCVCVLVELVGLRQNCSANTQTAGGTEKEREKLKSLACEPLICVCVRAEKGPKVTNICVDIHCVMRCVCVCIGETRREVGGGWNGQNRSAPIHSSRVRACVCCL